MGLQNTLRCPAVRVGWCVTGEYWRKQNASLSANKIMMVGEVTLEYDRISVKTEHRMESREATA